MQKRICPVCGLPWWSAAQEKAWRCSRCGAQIPVPPEEEQAVHEICQGCKRNHVYFERFCPGIRGEWTIRKCKQARQEARRNWDDYELNREWRSGSCAAKSSELLSNSN